MRDGSSPIIDGSALANDVAIWQLQNVFCMGGYNMLEAITTTVVMLASVGLGAYAGLRFMRWLDSRR